MLQSPFTVFNCALEPAGRQSLHSLEKRPVFTLGDTRPELPKKDPGKRNMFCLDKNMTQQINELLVFILVLKNAKCLVNNKKVI